MLPSTASFRHRSTFCIGLCCALGLLLGAGPALAHPTGGPAVLSLQMRPAPSAERKLAASSALFEATATAAPQGGRDRELTALDAPSDSAPKFYERGWFWPVLGGIVAAVIITVVIAESVGGSDRLPQSSLGNFTVAL